MITINEVCKILQMTNTEVGYFRIRYPQYFIRTGKGNRGIKYFENKIFEFKKFYNEYAKFKCICNRKFFTEQELKAHEEKCKFFQSSIISNDLKQSILNMYNEEHSMNYICNKLNLSRSSVQKFLEENNIHIRNIYESNKCSKRTELIRKTCLERYGTINVLSKGTPIYQKRNENVLKKYGVDNVRKCQFVKDKCKQICLEKYGKTAVELGHENMTSQLSKPHKCVSSWLTEHNISHENEVHSKFRKIINGKVKCPIPDILIEDRKIVIEIYGDLWHANPKFYKENDLIPKYRNLTLAKDIWKYDKERKEFIESFGYKVYEIWENDINNKDLSEILNFLL